MPIVAFSDSTDGLKPEARERAHFRPLLMLEWVEIRHPAV